MPLGANKAGLFGAAGASAGFDTGVWFGGYSGSGVNTIQYITISTTGNATDFGDLQRAKDSCAAVSNGNTDRGVVGGGTTGNDVALDEIGYVTISSPGDSTDFGNLTTGRNAIAAASNGSSDRGVWGGGAINPVTNILDYVTISSTGNATDFGDLTSGRHRLGALSSATGDRGVWAGGTSTNIMDYITISSTGNATDFGDLSTTTNDCDGLSNGTDNRGVWAGIGGATTVMEYITISSAGDVTDFGDLTVARDHVGGLSNGTDNRGVFGSGKGSGSTDWKDEMDYITISSTGNATDFGDLIAAVRSATGCSNS